jgi:hypothetical protein
MTRRSAWFSWLGERDTPGCNCPGSKPDAPSTAPSVPSGGPPNALRDNCGDPQAAFPVPGRRRKKIVKIAIQRSCAAPASAAPPHPHRRRDEPAFRHRTCPGIPAVQGRGRARLTLGQFRSWVTTKLRSVGLPRSNSPAGSWPGISAAARPRTGLTGQPAAPPTPGGGAGSGAAGRTTAPPSPKLSRGSLVVTAAR